MRKGTFTIEYAIVIIIVVLALVGMSIYIKRAVSGKWREAADAIGFGRQFDPDTTCCPTCKIKCENPPQPGPQPEPEPEPEPEPKPPIMD